MDFLSRFCEYEDKHFYCRREWCWYTCPIIRYRRFMEKGWRKNMKGYTKILYEDIPDCVKRAVLSEALGEDVDVVQGKVKYLRKQAESNDSVDEFKNFMEVEDD